MKNLVIDGHLILDLWSNRLSADQVQITSDLLQGGIGHSCWLTSASLLALEQQHKSTLVNSGCSIADAAKATKALLRALSKQVRLLSTFGFHLSQALQSDNDLADSEMVLAAGDLQGATAIVTHNKRFLVGNDLLQLSPAEAQAWLSDTDAARQSDFIDLKTQQDFIRPQLERNILCVLKHGQYVMGSEIAALEAKLAKYVGAKHCIANASGTDALLMAMMAYGIGPGDEVITTPFTFIATGEMIALLGAKPVFVDIDPRTYNIDPNKIAQAITSNTKAIMPVSLYGQCAEFDAINNIAAQYNLPVIEDAAQSFGATYYGKQSCALSTIGCTSFFPSKPLGAYGDGGACFTDDDELAKILREIRLHGQDRRYHHPRIGINGRLDTLQAAVLLAKMELFAQEVEARANIGQYYSELISAKNAALPADRRVTPPYIEQYNTSVYAQYTVVVKERDQVQQRLTKLGVFTAVHYPVPLHKQPALQTNEYTLAIAEELSEQVISLPMHPYLTCSEQENIINALFASLV